MSDMRTILKQYADAQERVRMAKQGLDDIRLELGYVIRHTREKKGMKLIQVARAIGVSSPFLYDVETGRRALSLENLEKLTKVLVE